MTCDTKTHQQRWRSRLRETHDRLDVYLPKALAADVRRHVAGNETVSTVVERCLIQTVSGTRAPTAVTAPERPMVPAAELSPETLAYATARAATHGVCLEDFLLAAMRGVSTQSSVMIRGLPYYIRTDIKSFFVKVPRAAALAKITAHTADEQFNAYLLKATETELADVMRLGQDAALFPIYEEGVAQGSCLSPLLCNLLLTDFDELMNGRGVVCIRYIDDFILFAKNKTTAFKALNAGRLHLEGLGLDVYDPLSADPKEQAKADHGLVSNGFIFLGCEIKGARVRPAKKNRDRLKDKIKAIFDSTLGAFQNPTKAALNRNTYVDAVRTAALTIRGWGNTHFFCTDQALMKTLDVDLGQLFDDFGKQVRRRIEQMPQKDKKRALGFFLLEDCNTEQQYLVSTVD